MRPLCILSCCLITGCLGLFAATQQQDEQAGCVDLCRDYPPADSDCCLVRCYFECVDGLDPDRVDLCEPPPVDRFRNSLQAWRWQRRCSEG